MDGYSEVFVGRDTSKLKISVAVVDGERTGEVRFFGDISSGPAAVASAGQASKGRSQAPFLLRGRPYRIRSLSA